MMKPSTENMMKVGGAVMAVGTMAAVTAGLVAKNSSSAKKTMKKLAKKSVKAMDSVVSGINSMVK